MSNLTQKDKLAKLERSRRKLKALRDSAQSRGALAQSSDSQRFGEWQQYTLEAIKLVFGEHSHYVEDFNDINYDNPFKLLPGGGNHEDTGTFYKAGLSGAALIIQEMIMEIEKGADEETAGSSAKSGKVEILGRAVSGSRVFIGHGRSPLWARVQLFLEKELGLEVVTYESESRVGESIVPVLEEMLDRAEFAVLVLTAEDETAAGARRARQNVIHEAGLFQGKLGFKKAILLKQDGVEDFSNVAGLQHISFTGERIEQAFWELQRVLKKQGLIR